MRMARNQQDPVARIPEQTSHHISPGSETSPQSPHPRPGVQLTGGNRQIRTTVPPLARGVTPVIAAIREAILVMLRAAE